MEEHGSGCYMIDDEYNVIGVNDTAREIYPQLELGKKCYACLMGLDAPCGPCPVANGIKGPRVYTDPIRHISEMVDAVDYYDPQGGLCHALVFSTVGNDAVLSETLPTNAEELKTLALIKALTVDYYDVFSVDLNDGSMILYRLNGKPLEADSPYRKVLSYEEGIAEYIRKYVYEEDQKALIEGTKLDYIRKVLENSETMLLHYRVLYRGEIHYFYRKMVRLGSAGHFDRIVVGIGLEDEEVRNREKRLRLEKNLKQITYHSKTGLLTKEAFLIKAQELLEQRQDLDFDLCVLRVENLDLIKHQYGHIMRAGVLRVISSLLKEYETDTMCIAFMGGSTFASISQNQPAEDRKNSIAEFREKILKQSEIKNLVLKWSVYTEIDRKMPLQETYEKANFALATIRANAHQDYVEFDRSIIQRLDWEEQVEHDFHRALENGEFVACFQPKYSTQTKQIAGAEALVRWIKPDGTSIPPASFIPVLERRGLIDHLDQEVFRQTCRLQKSIRARGLRPVPVSVNLSRSSMFTQDVAETYASLAEEYGVEMKLLPIEITESAAVRATSIRSFADLLVARGFELHMDDFGSGYSSLVSLELLPFAGIKIDKSLVDNIGRARSESLLRHTIEFAKESGMTVIAEGVETMEQYMFLRFAGCDEVQGYFFSKPVSGEEFLSRLDRE